MDLHYTFKRIEGPLLQLFLKLDTVILTTLPNRVTGHNFVSDLMTPLTIMITRLRNNVMVHFDIPVALLMKRQEPWFISWYQNH
jgi:hypothetical protein